MRSAVESYGCIDPEMQNHLNRMRELMLIVDDNNDELWSCHAATRGFSAFLGLPYEVKDGFFVRKGTCHSWLETSTNGDIIVIDILPMGAHGGPIVADIGGFAPWNGLYIEDRDYYSDSLKRFEEEGKLFERALLAADAKLALTT
jgi:hypothetical protein